MLLLLAESWTWYAIAMSVTLCRFVSRLLLLKSPSHLQADDWAMLFAVCTYTTLIVCINIVADQSSNLLPPDFDIKLLTAAEIAHREYGSKLVLVVEQMQLATIWTLKATLLIMYHRLTIAVRQNLAVKLLAVYTGVGFAVMEALYLGVWCRPFHMYWAVPSPNPQCTAATNHLITNAVLNISSDLVLLSIGLSMFVQSKLPLKRKLIVYCVFSLGVFVILSAVLNKYYSFTQPFGSAWTFWYVRESSTAFIVANIPYTWTLLRRIFNLKAFHIDDSVNRSASYHCARSARGRQSGRQSGSHTGSGNHSHLLGMGHCESQRPQSVQTSCCLEPREKRKESQASSGVSEDLEAARFSVTTFVPLLPSKPVETHGGSRRPILRIESWDTENEYSSPVDLPGRAFYCETNRNQQPGPLLALE